MKHLAFFTFLFLLGMNQASKAEESISDMLQTLTVVRINPCTANWSMVKSDYGYSYGCSSPNYAPFYVPEADSLVAILRAQATKINELEARVQKLEQPK